MAGRDDLRELLDEQAGFYRAVAAEYDAHALPFPGANDELNAALDAFRPTGSVLELACGPGTWTRRLLRHADGVTAVDASAEMIDIAAVRVKEQHTKPQRVRFVQADVFEWRPDRRYDVVFFGFWLSHVPPERFAAFWSLVDDCLRPGGRVCFVDDAHRTGEELIEGEDSPVIQRRLTDGTAYRIVKVPYRPEELQQQLDGLGWHITVRATSGPFYWGAGTR